MSTFNKRLTVFLIALWLLIEFRLFQVATEHNNWKGMFISTLHVSIVAVVARWGVLKSLQSRLQESQMENTPAPGSS